MELSFTLMNQRLRLRDGTIQKIPNDVVQVEIGKEDETGLIIGATSSNTLSFITSNDKERFALYKQRFPDVKLQKFIVLEND